METNHLGVYGSFTRKTLADRMQRSSIDRRPGLQITPPTRKKGPRFSAAEPNGKMFDMRMLTFTFVGVGFIIYAIDRIYFEGQGLCAVIDGVDLCRRAIGL